MGLVAPLLALTALWPGSAITQNNSWVGPVVQERCSAIGGPHTIQRFKGLAFGVRVGYGMVVSSLNPSISLDGPTVDALQTA